MQQNYKRIVVLISGHGSNLQAVIDATKNNILPNTKVVRVISNKGAAFGLKRAREADISHTFLLRKKEEKRTDYDTRLVEIVRNARPDLIVLAGWMRILTKTFIGAFPSGSIINVHPALPKQFPGGDGVGDAWKAFVEGKITQTGLMIHEVIEELDAGKVLETVVVPILNTDTLVSLRKRVQAHEKFALVKAIYNKLAENQSTNESSVNNVYRGKVRQMHDLGYNVMAMEHSDRLSAFDRAICEVPGKGRLLMDISRWWFQHTKDIIPNHYKSHNSNVMFVRKCNPIMLEIVVRGYITGSTKTSLWTHYAAGEREYCGHTFADGLVKNQRLDKAIITPTTKGETDELISANEIIEQGYLSTEDWKRVSDAALELFARGQYEAKRRGLILVDTKYEFGRDAETGEIILIDEIHTPDSSRYWIAEEYKMTESVNGAVITTKSVDKDAVRNYLKLDLKWDPYDKSSSVPEIPQELLTRVFAGYSSVWSKLWNYPPPDQTTWSQYAQFDVVCEHYWNQVHDKCLVIISGSQSDRDFVAKLMAAAKKQNLYARWLVGSAHKTPRRVLKYIDDWNSRCNVDRTFKMVWIAVAGRSNALGGFVAANTNSPVICCPPFKDKLDMQINLHSTLQMPSDVPAMTVLDPRNAVLAAKRIL